MKRIYKVFLENRKKTSKMKGYNSFLIMKQKYSSVRLLFILLFVALPWYSKAQVMVPFTPREGENTPESGIYRIRGDFNMIGNINLTRNPVDNIAVYNNAGAMMFVDVDQDNTTVNSSMATLDLPTGNSIVPDCSNILFAGLYWGGVAHGCSPGDSPDSWKDYVCDKIGNGTIYNNYSLSIEWGSTPTTNITYTFTSLISSDAVVFRITPYTVPEKVEVQINNGTFQELETTSVTYYFDASSNRVYEVLLAEPFQYGTGDSMLKVGKFLAYRNTDESTIGMVVNEVDFDKKKIKFRYGDEDYIDIEANNGEILYISGDGDRANMYSAFADVTDYVKTHGVGAYYAANIPGREGDSGNNCTGSLIAYSGESSGWSLIVVYENEGMSWKDVSIFDGFAYVDAENTGTTSYPLNITGIQTAQNGPITPKLGILAFEGDVNISPSYTDFVQIKDVSDNWVKLTHTGSTDGNDFFNGTVTTGGNLRVPDQTYNYGVDIIMIDLDNPDNSIIANNQTEMNLEYGTNRDMYVITCIAMSVDAYVPEIEPYNYVSKIAGSTVFDQENLTVLPGQEVEYVLEIRNIGNEPFTNSLVEIPIPYNTVYHSSSAEYFSPITGGALTYSAQNNLITWEIDGDFPVQEGAPLLARLTYTVVTTTDCYVLNGNCNKGVAIQGYFSGQGVLSGTEFDHIEFTHDYEVVGACHRTPVTDPTEITFNFAGYVSDNCPSNITFRTFVYLEDPESSNAVIPVSEVQPYYPSDAVFYDKIDESTGDPAPDATEYTFADAFPREAGTTTYYAVYKVLGENCWQKFYINVLAIEATLCEGETLDNIVVWFPDEDAVDITRFLWYLYTPDRLDSVSIDPATYIVVPEDDGKWVRYTTCSPCSEDEYDIGSNYIELHINDKPVVTTDDRICYNEDYGTIILTATGGSGSYTYYRKVDADWIENTVLPINEFDGLASGTYTFKVTDSYGCETELSHTLVSPSENIILSVTGHADVSCAGTTDGSVSLFASGGNEAPYQYSYSVNSGTIWSSWEDFVGNNPVVQVTGLIPGTYIFKVRDRSGCESNATTPVIINQNSEPVISGCFTSALTVNMDSGSCYASGVYSVDAIIMSGYPDPSVTYSLYRLAVGGELIEPPYANGVGTGYDYLYPSGTTRVVISASNLCNTVSCSFDVIVIDTQNPSVNCRVTGDLVKLLDAGEIYYTASGGDLDVTATDNCPSNELTYSYSINNGPSVTSGTLNGVEFTVGTYAILWTVTDGSGNSSSCSFNLIVSSGDVPVIVCSNTSLISGEAKANTVITLYKGGTALTTPTPIDSGDEGIWSVPFSDISGGLGLGDEITATLTENGVESAHSATKTIIILYSCGITNLSGNVLSNVDAQTEVTFQTLAPTGATAVSYQWTLRSPGSEPLDATFKDDIHNTRIVTILSGCNPFILELTVSYDDCISECSSGIGINPSSSPVITAPVCAESLIITGIGPSASPIKLYLLEGPDEILLGETTSSLSGSWSINIISTLESGSILLARSGVCGSGLSAEVTVVPLPVSPVLREGADRNVCSGTFIDEDYLISLFTPVSGVEYNFYLDAACTIPADLPVTADYNTSVDHTFYVRSELSSTGCESSLTSIYTLIINVDPLPGVPTGTLSAYSCDEGTINLSLAVNTPSTGMKYNYYRRVIELGNPLDILIPDGSAAIYDSNSTYWVETENEATGCKSIKVEILVTNIVSPSFTLCPSLGYSVSAIMGEDYGLVDYTSDVSVNGSAPVVSYAYLNEEGDTLSLSNSYGSGVGYPDFHYPVGSTTVVIRATNTCAPLGVECRFVITVTKISYLLRGTVFPFVQTGVPEFDILFETTASLYPVPPLDVEDAIDAILESDPLYVTQAIFYDGSIFVAGTPKNPGDLSLTTNPGSPINWSLLGKNVDEIDNTLLTEEDNIPSNTIGVYTFEGVVSGDYVLVLSRPGYLTRFAKITVTSDGVLGHREILPGDVDDNLVMNSYDLSKINSKASSYPGSSYDPRYDLNGNGDINQGDISLLLFYLGAHIELYIDTATWLLDY